MGKSRQSADLVSDNNIFVDIVNDKVGIGTTNPGSDLTVIGDGNFSGSLTATTIIGALTGTATTALSVAANSVGLGTDTYGDYVKNITGTANQITVTSGTGEGSIPTLSIPNQFTAPQDVEITRDLQVNRNLNVNGSITIGGTAATLFTSELKIYDPDIVLGFRTDAFGNDVSTDNTANHGGIAVASTEGNPLVQLFIAGIETNPATYKKIMWFKAGEFAGLGTDAWLSNYAIGIGSTQVPNGVRLSAGGMQVTDNSISSPQLNISGVSTFTNGPVLVGSGTSTGTASQQLQVTGGGYFSGAVGIGYTLPGFNLSVNGSGYFNSNLVAGTKILVSTQTDTGTSNQQLQVTGGAYVSGNLGIGTTNPTVALQLSPNASISNINANIALSSTAGAAATVAQFLYANANASYLRIKATRNSTGSDWTTASTKLVQVIDVTEQGYIEFNPNGATYGLAFGQGSNEYMRILNGGNVGIGVTNPLTKLQVAGTSGNTQFRAGTATNGYFEINAFDSSPVYCVVGGSNASAAVFGSQSNIPTIFFTNNTDRGRIDTLGNFLVGTSSPTGTASQPLQVAGGAYFSGSVGIGTTNPNGIAAQTSQLTLSGSNSGGGAGYHQFLTVSNTTATNPSKFFRLNSTGGIEIVNNAYTATIFTLDNSGNLTVPGNVTGYSDESLKDNIQTIPNALDKVIQLRGVEYDRKDIEGNPHNIGVIAQEVEKIIPEVVTTQLDGLKSVSYGNLVGLLIEAIKEQQKQIDELKIKLEEK